MRLSYTIKKYLNYIKTEGIIIDKVCITVQMYNRSKIYCLFPSQISSKD